MGPRCEWPCPNGFWGSGCQQRCSNCRWCNPINGTFEIFPPEIANRFTTKLVEMENVIENANLDFGFGNEVKAK